VRHVLVLEPLLAQLPPRPGANAAETPVGGKRGSPRPAASPASAAGPAGASSANNASSTPVRPGGGR
jgi:hypothetical protein